MNTQLLETIFTRSKKLYDSFYLWWRRESKFGFLCSALSWNNSQFDNGHAPQISTKQKITEYQSVECFVVGYDWLLENNDYRNEADVPQKST